MNDDEVIDDETKLSVSEKEFVKTLRKEQVLRDLSFEELLEEIKRRYKLMVGQRLDEAEEGTVVTKINPLPPVYGSQQQEE